MKKKLSILRAGIVKRCEYSSYWLCPNKKKKQRKKFEKKNFFLEIKHKKNVICLS